MLNVDLEQFWKDDKLAHEENCFSKNAPQVALGIHMSEECVYYELGKIGNPWGEVPREKRIYLNRKYNDKAEKIVGRKLLPEDIPSKEEVYPPYKIIGEVFEGRYIDNGHSSWLESSCNTPKELENLLDRVEKLDLREFILSKNWENEKKRIFETYGTKPPLWRSIRGPVTLATSIYGVENLIFLILDAPELAVRFSNVIYNVMAGYIAITNKEAGYEHGMAPGGFAFADDNCYLLNPEMYELFAYPILKRVFELCSPNPRDTRYQHSDSDMKHLLPILGKLNLTACNFGPTVLVDEIRRYMPNTMIDGCISPFTFMSNDENSIIMEARRDCEMAKPTKGLNLRTAGSINNGSLLSSMRAVMFAIQNYGRY